jgi:hypothetical protein
VVRYQVDPSDVEAFLAAMRRVREVRLRAGAADWRLYRDLAQPDDFTERRTVDSCTEYLRHAIRLDEVDKAALAACHGDAPGWTGTRGFPAPEH